MIVCNCPNCRNEVSFEDRYLGKNVLCPFCQSLFVPPYPHSGMGIASVLLAVLASSIVLLVVLYNFVIPPFESEYISSKKLDGLVRFVGFLGFIVSWAGIACGGIGYTQKKRRLSFAKWGLILNIAVNVLFCAGVIGYKLMPKPTPTEPEPETEEARALQIANCRLQIANVTLNIADSGSICGLKSAIYNLQSAICNDSRHS